jgi:hypothetical protein
LALAMILAFIVSSTFAGNEPGTVTPEGKGYFFYMHDFTSGAGQENEFDFSRMYIGTKYQISEEFMARYLTDISHQTGGGKFEVFTKYAYLDWDLNQWKSHLVMGLQGTNNWSIPEKAWGYRSIRKSPMESSGDYWGGLRSAYEQRLDDWAIADPARATELMMQRDNFHSGASTKMGSSADMGIGIKWKPSKLCYVNFMVRNGGGYKKAENDMYKNFQARAGRYFLDKAVHVSAYAEIEPWSGQDEAGESKVYKNIQWDLFASYQQKDVFLVGVNYNSKKIPGSLEDITASCISGFGNVYIIKKKLKGLARYDIYQSGFNDAERQPGLPELETNAGLLIVGLDYMPVKKVHIIPNVQILSFEDSNLDADSKFYLHLWFKL